MKNGWIKMYRTLLDSAVFADAELLRVLIYCVLQASYRAMTIPVGRQVITLAPGQLLYGRKAVSSRLGIGEGKLRGLMNQLEQMGLIAVQSNNRYSVVTILHWEQYQNEQGKAEFPFDCDFLDENESASKLFAEECVEELIEDAANAMNLQELVQDKAAVEDLLNSVEDNQQKSALLTALEHVFDESIASKEPTDNHKQEEKNHKTNNKIKKQENKEDIGAALRAVRRYRRADGETITKGKCECGPAPIEGHNVPGGAAAVPCRNSADAHSQEHDAIHHDYVIEMQYDVPDAEQLAQMEQGYWQQYEWYHADECNLTLPADGEEVLMELNKLYEQNIAQQNQINITSLDWDIADDNNWGIDLQAYAENVEEVEAIDPYELEWIEAHKLFNQLWNRYPVKVGKQKVSEAQIMELYEVGRQAMLQAIDNYKKKKYRVPKKYWMNGSTFFNGGYLGYI